MCLLIVCEPGHQPTAEELRQGSCANPHGFGFAMVAGDKIIHKRGMSAKKINREFLRLRAEHPDGWAMWHSRYATHGVKNESNCHPYPIGDDGLTYLAHNGVLSQKIPAGDKRSDTRVFAEDTLTAMGGVSALNNDTVLDMISKWAGGSKIAVLTLDPASEYQMIMINENLGKWVDGVWYSNDSHKTKTYTYTDPYWSAPSKYVTIDDVILGSDDLDDVLADVCSNCQNMIEFDGIYTWCDHCSICYDCQQDIKDCLCYDPQRDKVSSLGYSYGW